MNRRWAVFLGTAGLVLGAFAVRAQISGNVPPSGQSVPEQIPYRGYLENDGAPYNGLAWLRFQIFTVSSGGNPLWTEEHGDTAGVPVANGSFGVALGSINAFTTANVTTIDNRSLFQYPELYIGVSVKLGSASANYVDLGQRQRILSSPYSMVSRQAENFSVSGQLSVLGTAGITGMLTLSNGLTVASGGVTVSNGSLTVSNGNASISGNASVSGSLTSSNGLNVNSGVLAVSGNTSSETAGSVVLSGGLHVPGRLTGWNYSGVYDTGGLFNGQQANIPMLNSANSWCFLTFMSTKSTGSDWSECYVEITSGWWYLRARTTGDSDAGCRAQCITF